MKNIDMTKLSSKGQIVIPGDIREIMGLETGTKFLIFAEGDTLILKRVGPPSETEIKKILSATRAVTKKSGLKNDEVEKAIMGYRKSRNK